jgi:RNA polymerase sigma-54 factor
VVGEDKRHPLSDQRLCELLAREGMELSRRTVAKYRGEFGIPGTAARRER